MKIIIRVAAAAGLALGLSACGVAHQVPRPAVTRTVTASPRATSPASPAASLVSANERTFVDGEAASIPDVPVGVVAGATMRAYIRFQHALGAAYAAVGSPDPGDSVAQIADGFKLCWPDTSGTSSGCDVLSQFTTNRAGQIIGVSVNGQSVAGRIAIAPAVTSGGLTISDVVSYRTTDAQNVVGVAFKLTDNGYRPVNTSPALLASLSGASGDTNYAGLPATLAPRRRSVRGSRLRCSSDHRAVLPSGERRIR